MKKRTAAIAVAFSVILGSCGGSQGTVFISESDSTVQSEASEMSVSSYDDLTAEEKELLERAGVPGSEGTRLTDAQSYVLDGVSDMLTYIETKYREKFIVDYFHSMSVNEDYDSLYVYPEWSDKGLDIVTIERRQKSTDGYEYADDYAAAYCRQTLESMSLQYFVEKYGEGRAKIYMTMGCDESYSFDGKESPEELLKNDVVWGNGVLFLSEADIAEQDLESVLKEYGEALREAGIETAIGVFLMRADAFESVRYSTYSTMYEDPGMLVRYDVLVSKEGTEIKRLS